MSRYAIILAAGKGTRMKSSLLKVAHDVAGKPIVEYIIDTVRALGSEQTYLIVGHQADMMKERFNGSDITHVMQEEQLGTGHAAQQVDTYLAGKKGTVIVLAGDCPLIQKETLEKLITKHQESNAACTILSTKMDEPAKYGRILRGPMGSVIGIREAKDCSSEELAIQEINTGVYAFNVDDLFTSLKEVKTENAQGEYYLTDVIEILKAKGKPVSGYCMDDPDEAIGINTRMDLAKTNAVIYKRNNQKFMEEGVTIKDPRTTFIDSTVQIGIDTIIEPFSVIKGETKIGQNCRIGSHTRIENREIKEGETVAPHSNLF